MSVLDGAEGADGAEQNPATNVPPLGLARPGSLISRSLIRLESSSASMYGPSFLLDILRFHGSTS